MRIAVLGAGGPAGVNTLRALELAGHETSAVDANERHLEWCKVWATWWAPQRDIPDFSTVDVVIPQPDSLVLWAVQHVDRSKTLLPDEGVIWQCQNKQSTALTWWRQNLREYPPATICEPWPDTLHIARELLGLPFWLRATQGAGARAAIKVDSLDQGYHWLRFWQSRGAEIEWVAEEYLPGRDLAWSSIWFDGELITSFARERIEYLYPHLTPEGLTGTPTVARIVYDDRVNATAEAAVRAIDSRPNGIYSVDLREDIHGLPRPTEINAGRGFTTFGLWSLHSWNFLDLYVRLAAFGEVAAKTTPPTYNALPEGLTLSRHIDCGHVFTQERVTQAVAA